MGNIKTAEILCVGTEILLGDIINTNAAYLSRELADMGISQFKQTVIGDNSHRLETAVKQAMEECDLLVITGGLGPTYDDITKETVARVLGKELRYSEDCLKEILAYFKKRGRHMTENNIKQAMVIDDSVILPNPVGTAPGALCNAGNMLIVLLPGPPAEMMKMWSDEARPRLEKYCDKILVSKNINIVGIGEAHVAQALNEMMTSAVNPTIAPYCRTAEVRLRITASADTREQAAAMCDETIEQIRNTEVGQYIYGIDTDLPTAVMRLLESKGMKLCCAESCTGGLIAKMLTDIPGASDTFNGGVVGYANHVKNKALDVSLHALETYGAVSHQVATRMAEGACALTGSDVGVAVTGIAGPGGGTEEKPVGLVYIAVCINGNTTVKKYKFGSHQSRDKIREMTAANAFIDVMKAVKKHQVTISTL